jgi:hypothetical protein
MKYCVTCKEKRAADAPHCYICGGALNDIEKPQDPRNLKLSVQAIRFAESRPEVGIIEGTTGVYIKFSEPTDSMFLSSEQAAALALLLMNKAKAATMGQIDDTPSGPTKIIGGE